MRKRKIEIFLHGCEHITRIIRMRGAVAARGCVRLHSREAIPYSDVLGIFQKLFGEIEQTQRSNRRRKNV